jgi:hypothetical protein
VAIADMNFKLGETCVASPLSIPKQTFALFPLSARSCRSATGYQAP